jgi:hypothetical protein
LAVLCGCHVISFRLLCSLGADSCGAMAVIIYGFNMGDSNVYECMWGYMPSF